MTASFDQLINEALTAHFSGWDFSWLNQRLAEDELPWDYRQIVQNHLPQAKALLDMGTGGGEFLIALSGKPKNTHATESYPPNIELAKSRLEPLGIHLHALEDDTRLPLPDESFDLVINRHESFDPGEVQRILQPGGLFITQQVGGRDNIALNQFLAPQINLDYAGWSLESAVQGLIKAGFTIETQQEAFPQSRFLDIGAVVYYLKVIEWQIPGFDVQKYREQLFAMHQVITEQGYFTANYHRFIITACKPI